MLKLTVKPGEYLLVGEDVKVVFTGGSSNNMHILVDAPKTMNIVRSRALEKLEKSAETGAGLSSDRCKDGQPGERYYKDPAISPQAREQINAILRKERQKARAADTALKAGAADAALKAGTVDMALPSGCR